VSQGIAGITSILLNMPVTTHEAACHAACQAAKRLLEPPALSVQVDSDVSDGGEEDNPNQAESSGPPQSQGRAEGSSHREERDE
jgi:hypothetical protein